MQILKMYIIFVSVLMNVEINDYSFISKINKLREELIQLMEKVRETIVHRSDIVVWFQDAFRNIDWYDSEKKQFRVLKNISKKYLYG